MRGIRQIKINLRNLSRRAKAKRIRIERRAKLWRKGEES